jgi:penicillin-binding protein 1A
MWLTLAGLCAAVLSLAGTYLYLDPQIPKPETYRNVKLETPLRIYAKNGALLAEFGERRLIPITLDQVPQHFINALLDTEDKRFYEHSGIDFISLTNDALALVGTFVTEGELGGGASTITMQLARNVSFSLEQRFLRKFKEMLLALKIEQELSKDEILELYINLVPFGKRAYGAEAAARTYYGKSLQTLELAQLAMLAGIPQAPTAGNPINGPERALRRRNLVLSRMLAQESITREMYDAARNAPISAQIYARDLDVPSPYAAEWVRQQAAVLLPDLYTGGYEIDTTIDGDLQAEAIAALRRGLHNYDEKHGYRGAEAQVPEALQAQLVAAAPELLADPAGEYPQVLTNEVAGFLQSEDRYGGMEPAVVLAVNDEIAIVQHNTDRRTVVELADSTWARTYINVDRRGPAVDSLTSVLAVGDQIRLREKATADGGIKLVLSQLPEVQGAVISLDPKNGAVRSLVGGYDFFRNQYNHALQAARQPGSGFKPLVYSAAIAEGITPADIFMDAPLVFDDENLESQYRPDNDNNRYNGPTRLREALYRSINLVSMRVLLKAGAGDVIDHVAKFGFDTRTFPRNTQLAIGGGTMAVTPVEMARAYAVFANGGYLVDPHIITRIRDGDGNEIIRANHPRVCKSCEAELLAKQLAENDSDVDLLESEPASLEALLAEMENVPSVAAEEEASETADAEPADSEAADTSTDDAAATEIAAGPIRLPEPEVLLAPRILDERNAYIMNSMLQDVIKRGTGRAARRLQRNDLAGKTGTTNDAADTWFNGYNLSLVTTVWVGFSNHDPLGARAYGSNTPLPIWIDFMEDALAGVPELSPDQPPGLVTMKIDPTTGDVAAPGQRGAVFEYFLSEFAPTSQPEVRNPGQNGQPGQAPPEDINAIDLF